MGKIKFNLKWATASIIIESSSLDVRLKKRIKNSFIVANASYKLWRDTDNDELKF